MMLNLIQLLAIESDKQRTIKIHENIERLGLEAKIINEKLSQKNDWWDKKLFDRILLDVPCSASGIVRRHVDIKWLRRQSDFKKFGDNQLNLLRAAWPMLKNNGKLLYVTCSIFEEENKDIIEKFKQESSDAVELKIDFPENIAYINNQIIPSDNHDGLYYALIKKN